MRNRNASKNRDQHIQQPSMSLIHGYNNKTPYAAGVELSPSIMKTHQQQQLMLMAAGQGLQMQSLIHAGARMLGGLSPYESFASTRVDSSGSHRENFVDRNRHHRGDNRSNRSKPYRSRSRSPPRHSYRSRDRSPDSHRSRHQDTGRKHADGSNYHRWGKN